MAGAGGPRCAEILNCLLVFFLVFFDGVIILAEGKVVNNFVVGMLSLIQ